MYGARTGLLRGGGGVDLVLLKFNFSGSIIFTFRNYFTLCRIVLCISSKKIFLPTLAKSEPVCMSEKGWCVRFGQEGVLCVRLGENV